MPSLSRADRDLLLGPISPRCLACASAKVRHYCRSCDEFFLTCACAAAEDSTHVTHRVYLWTPHGVIAAPNFDGWT